MRLPIGAGGFGGGIVLGVVAFVVYLVILAIGLWIWYTVMRHAVTNGVLRALDKAGITTHGRVGTLAVGSESPAAVSPPAANVHPPQ